MAAPTSQQIGQGGPAGGRKRNTFNNLMSKQGFNPGNVVSGGGLPTLDPSSVANYYSQLQTLQSTLATQLAGFRQQRVGLRGEAMVQRADIRTQGREALVAGIGDVTERGVLGGSADLENRIKTRAATASGVADVNRQLYDQLAQTKIEGQLARLAATQQAQGLASGVLAQRMDLAAQEQQNQIALRVARMQAQASATSTAAEMAMARKQLAIAKQTAQAARKQANNPFDPYAAYLSRQNGQNARQAGRAAGSAVQNAIAALYGRR